MWTTEEVKRADEADQDKRPLDPTSTSTDPDLKRFKPISMTDVENLAEQVDEHTSLRTLATSHPLDPEAEENVSKKARVSGNVLYIRGGDVLKLDVNTGLAECRIGISLKLRGCLDRRTSRRPSQSWR